MIICLMINRHFKLRYSGAYAAFSARGGGGGEL